ncbi:amidohydrolase family protein [Mameliella alba]|uniref:amidohydrolase family protein n=2 Tax=Mameliella alba TaxID=561184 RepID=UPI0018E3356C
MFARIIAGMASERSEEKTVMIDASKLKTCHAASGTASKGFRSTEPLDQLKRSLKAFVAGVIKRFSDAIHFESQLTHPTALAEAMVPCGTTTIYSECLDLLSAAADEGIEAAQNLFRDHDKPPYRLFAFAPGKKTAATVTEAVLNMEPVIGLGEFEHFTYSSGGEDDFRKATWVREKSGFMNGHWGVTALSDMMLNYLPAIGVSNNHDVWTADDIEKSIRYGFPTHIKFGVGSSEVIKVMLRAIVDRKWPTDSFMFCADNISVQRLLGMGHMDWIVSHCSEMGINPIHAIKMATLNTARSFHMDDRLGSLPLGRCADIVLTDSLSHINPRFVLKGGTGGAGPQAAKKADIDCSGTCKQGAPGLDDLVPDQLDVEPLALSEDGGMAKVILFDVYGRGHASSNKRSGCLGATARWCRKSTGRSTAACRGCSAMPTGRAMWSTGCSRAFTWTGARSRPSSPRPSPISSPSARTAPRCAIA